MSISNIYPLLTRFLFFCLLLMSFGCFFAHSYKQIHRSAYAYFSACLFTCCITDILLHQSWHSILWCCNFTTFLLMDINIFSASTIATVNILIYVYLDMYANISLCFIPSAITGPNNMFKFC